MSSLAAAAFQQAMAANNRQFQQNLDLEDSNITLAHEGDAAAAGHAQGDHKSFENNAEWQSSFDHAPCGGYASGNDACGNGANSKERFVRSLGPQTASRSGAGQGRPFASGLRDRAQRGRLL